MTRSTILACVLCGAAGWWLASSPASPVRPEPQPQRPVLKFLSRMARLGLWVMLAGEQAPQPVEQLVKAPPRDADGNPILDNGRW
jgi:hypothetical protein